MSASPLFNQILEQNHLLENLHEFKSQYQGDQISRETLLARIVAKLTKIKLTKSQQQAILVEIKAFSNPTKPSAKTVIIGNGDVLNLEQARQKVAQFGVDGVMIGRGIFQNPYLFTQMENPSPADKLNLLLWHLNLWQKTWGTRKKFPILKKYFKIYVQGFEGASNLRGQLMEATTFEEVEKIVFTWLNK